MYSVPKLEKTKFIEDLNKNLISFAKKQLKINKGEKIKLTDKEEFLAETYQFTNEIESKLQDLDAGVLFIASYPGSVAVGKLLTRTEYLIYHIDFYYIGIICIFDRVLKLINHICGLGLSDRYVTLDIILNNSNVSQKIKEVLRKLDKSIVNIRTLQNQIKHKRKFWDHKLKDAAFFESILRVDSLKASLKREDLLTMKHLANIEHRSYIREKKRELKNNNKALIELLCGIYKEIHSVYEIRLKTFQS